MRLIVDIYAKVILESVVLILLFTLLFIGIQDEHANRGVLKIAGAQADTGGVDYFNYTDFKNFKKEGRNQKPKIHYDDNRVVPLGNCELADYIHAYDFAGNELPIRIMECMGPDGIKLGQDAAAVSATSYVFGTPGIYFVRVSAVDTGKRKSVCEFSIPAA